jgi:hypothetical protein
VVDLPRSSPGYEGRWLAWCGEEQKKSKDQ